MRRMPLVAGVVLFAMVLGAGTARVEAAAEPTTVAAPAPPAVLGAPTAVARFAPVFVDVAARILPSNPFDPAIARTWIVAAAPDGSTRAYLGFWYQDHERELVGGFEHLRPVGSAHWQVRFTPDVVGTWRWYVEGIDEQGAWRTPTRTLTVGASSLPGPLRRSPHSDRYLVHANGDPYFAVGENLSWADGRGTFAYDEWLDQLGTAGATFARFWMAPWGFGIEGVDTGLGDYSGRLDRAWQLDHALEVARRNGIQVELALLAHGSFSTQFNSGWADNPYNAANGGPLARPQDFFTDSTAKARFQRRLLYVVARWGYAPNLLAWELWNEVDLTDGFLTQSSVVADWHREMSDVIRFVDSHDHLISSSTAIFGNEAQLWSRGGLDFAQVHHYARIGDLPYLPNLFRTVPELTDVRRSQAPTLPVLFAELGVDSRGPAETRAVDPDGIGVHDGLWAGVVSGGFGTAMPWWWDHITHPEWDRYGPMLRTVAKFVHGVRFDREGFVPTTLDVGGAAPADVSARVLVGRTRVLAWVKDETYQWNHAVTRPVRGAALALTLPAGTWCGRFVDPWTGLGRGRVRTAGGAVTIAVPDFARDLALRLRTC